VKNIRKEYKYAVIPEKFRSEGQILLQIFRHLIFLLDFLDVLYLQLCGTLNGEDNNRCK